MKLVRVEFVNGRHSCESCGHPINNLYTVRLDTGKDLIIGSECAEKLLGYSAFTLLARYVNAAKREWKAQKPAPKDGEDREDYLTRRVAEKLNARKAWQVWKSQERTLPFEARQRLAARGIAEVSYPHLLHYRGLNGHDETSGDKCSVCLGAHEIYRAYQQQVRAEMGTLAREIAAQVGANTFDFIGVPGWKI